MTQNNNLQPFDFKGNQVRILTDEKGEPWFSGQDICCVLDTGTNHLREYLDADEITNIRTTDIVQNGGKAPVFISELGLYKLIMRSRKPEAREFRRWVTHEVLPQIRRTGGYIHVDAGDDEKTILARALEITQRTLNRQGETIRRQALELEEWRPLALLGEAFVSTDGTMSVTDAAKHFRTLDQRMSRDMVYGLLRGAGYVEARSNAPTVKAIRPGYMVARQGMRDGRKIGKPYARFTAKGASWFVDRFIYGNAALREFENLIE